MFVYHAKTQPADRQTERQTPRTMKHYLHLGSRVCRPCPYLHGHGQGHGQGHGHSHSSDQVNVNIDLCMPHNNNRNSNHEAPKKNLVIQTLLISTYLKTSELPGCTAPAPAIRHIYTPNHRTSTLEVCSHTPPRTGIVAPLCTMTCSSASRDPAPARSRICSPRRRSRTVDVYC